MLVLVDICGLQINNGYSLNYAISLEKTIIFVMINYALINALNLNIKKKRKIKFYLILNNLLN